MEAVVGEFLHLLGAAVGGVKLPEGFSVADGGALFSLAEGQGLGGAILPVLAKEGLLDEEARAPFVGAQLEAIRHTTLLAHELARIRAVLEGEGIDYVLLKGAYLRALWPAPWMRTSCDIDILIREADLTRASDAICAALSYTVRLVGFRDASLYAPGDSVHLELHFSLRDQKARSAALGAAWDHAERVGDTHEYRLRSDFAIFFLLFHLLGHMDAGGGGIRPVIDLALLARRGYDEDGLAVLLADCGLSRFAEVVLALGDAILTGKAIDGVPAALAEWLISGGMYGEMHRRAVVGRAKGSDRAARRTLRRYVLVRLFPKRRELSLTYPALARHPWLYPVCIVRRLFHLVFGGRLVFALRRRRAARRMRDVPIEMVEALFSALGLTYQQKTP